MSPGSVFAGHRIEAVAGRGGMGVVYRARQLSLDRTVALKVIAPALTQDIEVRRRFLRESRIAASIDHPNVIPIYYTGEEGDVAFIAMRYVAGDDLRTLVRREGRVLPERAARIVAQVGAALDAAHAAGLVHRDVKPANVLLGPDDHAYLTDFGLTKHVLSDPGVTRSGHWVGTLDFVAPEQIRGERNDARADVYGLGCVLHYALTGRAPFDRETDEAKLWAHLSEPPPHPSDAAPGVPAAMDQVVARALAKAPDQRFPSAGDLGRAALAAAGAAGRAGRERMVAIGAAAPVEVETRTAAAPAPAPPRRSRALPAALAAAVAIAAGAAAVLALGGDDPRRSDNASPSPTTEPVVKTVRIGGRLNAVAAAGGKVWVGAFLHRRLDAVDPAAVRRLKEPRPEIGVGLNGLAVSGNTLWAVLARDRELERLDTRTGQRIGDPIPLPDSASAVAADRDSVWVTVIDDVPKRDTLLRFDADTGRLIEELQITWGVRRLIRRGGALWLLASDPARLIRIDVRTKQRRKLPLETGRAGDFALDGDVVWVTLPDRNQLARVNARSLNFATVAVGSDPNGVTVQGGSVWVVNRASSTLSRVDARTSRVRGEIEVPINPYEIAGDGDALWVTSLASGRLARVTAPAG